MAERWCEREQDEVRDTDIETVGKVDVHTRNPWHLLTGEVIEMRPNGTPVLDNRGRPVVQLESFADLEHKAMNES